MTLQEARELLKKARSRGSPSYKNLHKREIHMFIFLPCLICYLGFSLLCVFASERAASSSAYL